MASRRRAIIPASTHTAFSWAPLKSSVQRASSSKFTCYLDDRKVGENTISHLGFSQCILVLFRGYKKENPTEITWEEGEGGGESSEVLGTDISKQRRRQRRKRRRRFRVLGIDISHGSHWTTGDVASQRIDLLQAQCQSKWVMFNEGSLSGGTAIWMCIFKNTTLSQERMPTEHAVLLFVSWISEPRNIHHRGNDIRIGRLIEYELGIPVIKQRLFLPKGGYLFGGTSKRQRNRTFVHHLTTVHQPCAIHCCKASVFRQYIVCDFPFSQVQFRGKMNI